MSRNVAALTWLPLSTQIRSGARVLTCRASSAFAPATSGDRPNFQRNLSHNGGVLPPQAAGGTVGMGNQYPLILGDVINPESGVKMTRITPATG